MIRAEFQDALADPRIQGILLDVDSPGGEVGGLFDLAGEILAGRQEKPIYAIANDAAFSAAYAIASSAERLFVTSTGGVGSRNITFAQAYVQAMNQNPKLYQQYLAEKSATVRPN